MTPQEIHALIERAGLRDVMSVFSSAIEIGYHDVDASGRRGYDGYSALAALLAFYGDERERDAVMRTVEMYDRFGLFLPPDATKELAP